MYQYELVVVPCCITHIHSSYRSGTCCFVVSKQQDSAVRMAAIRRACCVGFTGQGSQWVGMGKELLKQCPKAKDMLDEVDSIMGYSLSKIMFSGPEVWHL